MEKRGRMRDGSQRVKDKEEGRRQNIKKKNLPPPPYSLKKEQLHGLCLNYLLPTWIQVLPLFDLVFFVNSLSPFPFSLPGNSTCPSRAVQPSPPLGSIPQSDSLSPPYASEGFCLCLTRAFTSYCQPQCPQWPVSSFLLLSPNPRPQKQIREGSMNK